ncbi:hypothetical protein [Thalassobellus suaedae]|uniref:Uncharacterized protein n=1 Tax=Thalassobellus suaedae TaxID=3074124 RepID=A0ABY9XWS7_9FLAO|nr:hypothetical protein RHP51_05100 [Flavobacteriaceae bacterium HL-DH14]
MIQYINTDGRIYLITFKCTTTKFICNNSSALIKCIKENDKHRSLKSIKVFDPVKEKFTRASKETLKMFLIWDAESTEFFTNHYYFKS